MLHKCNWIKFATTSSDSRSKWWRVYIENRAVTCWHGDADYDLLISIDIPRRFSRSAVAVCSWGLGRVFFLIFIALTTRICDSAMIVAFLSRKFWNSMFLSGILRSSSTNSYSFRYFQSIPQHINTFNQYMYHIPYSIKSTSYKGGGARSNPSTSNLNASRE